MLHEGRFVEVGVAIIGFGGEAGRPLHLAPAIISTRQDQVDFLAKLRPHVNGQQVAIGIEGYPPGVAKSVGVYLLPCFGIGSIDKVGIVHGDVIGKARIGFGVDVNTQDRTVEIGGVLGQLERILAGGIRVGKTLVRTAVTECDIQHSIGAELDVPSVVVHEGPAVEEGLGVLEEDFLGRLGRGGTSRCDFGEAGDAGRTVKGIGDVGPVFPVVVNVYHPVVGKPGIEVKPVECEVGPGCIRNPVSDIKIDGDNGWIVRVEGLDSTPSLGDKEATRIVG